MSTNGRLAAALVVVIAAAGTYLAVGGSDDTSTTATTATPVAQETPAPEVEPQADPAATAEPATEKPGRYVDYSKEALASADGTRLLFFHASWCTQCQKLEQTIESEGLPAGVTVLKVDYDSNQDLRRKYGVTLQTTVVKVDAQGRKLESFVPYDDPQIGRVLDELV